MSNGLIKAHAINAERYIPEDWFGIGTPKSPVVVDWIDLTGYPHKEVFDEIPPIEIIKDENSNYTFVDGRWVVENV